MLCPARRRRLRAAILGRYARRIQRAYRRLRIRRELRRVAHFMIVPTYALYCMGPSEALVWELTLVALEQRGYAGECLDLRTRGAQAVFILWLHQNRYYEFRAVLRRHMRRFVRRIPL